MKIKKSPKKPTKTKNTQFNLLILIIFASIMMCVGYATINSIFLTVSGTASVAENGDVTITAIQRVDILNITETSSPEINEAGDAINFNLSVTVDNQNYDQDFYVKYRITITNDSLFEHQVQAANFTPTITGSGSEPSVAYEITDLQGNSALNSTIAPKTSEDFYVIIQLYPAAKGTWSISGETEIETEENNNGALMGSIPNNSTGDLSGNNTRVKITATVINTYVSAKTFSFSINNPNFKLTDGNGNNLGQMSINGETTDTYDFYIERLSTARFPSSTVKLNINFDTDNGSSNMGIVTLTVTPDPTLTDFEAPTISNVSASILPNSDNTYTMYKVNVSWTGTDNVGVDYYKIETYKANSSSDAGTKISTTQTVADETNIDITLPSDGYYYFKVYGVDTAQNTATSDEISNCSTSAGKCSKNNNTNLKWNFTVKITLTNAASSNGTTSNGVATINTTYDGTVTTTLSGTGNYGTPNGVNNPTITYANGTSETLSTNTTTAGYSYNNGNLRIWHITGNITMSASGSGCLVKGTKVLLANGKEKNIEDVRYDDLLAVWNYDTGKITYEYPLWIEKKQEATTFTRIYFDDMTYLDAVGGHSLYNADINLFVSYLDTNNFYVGTSIGKIDNDGNFKTVKVTKIANIKSNVEYYYVGSTTYYNIIANNVLTVSQESMISNLYGFMDNAIWPKEKEQIVKDPKNIVSYDEFKDILPYYMYTGFRAGEVGYLINNKVIDLPSFKYWVSKYISCTDAFMPPIQKNNENYWMVTTSNDIVNFLNKSKFLHKEGSYYELPTINDKNFIGWLNTSDNKIYKSGDTVEVTHGLHFIAKYK